MRIRGARVLVTGATGGLGHAIARTCATRGAEVIVTGRRAEVLGDLAADIGATAVVADLSRRTDVERLAIEAGDVDVLISNAALPAAGALKSLTVDEVGRALAVNVRAPLVLARLLAAGMTNRRRGHIVFVSSLAAAFPSPGLTVYNTTKAALASCALSLRGEFGPDGVGVSVVYPGPIRDAGMWADAGLALPRCIGTRTPIDVADAVVEAIEKNRSQVVVASPLLRLGALAARAAPGLFCRVAPHMRAAEMTAAMARSESNSRQS